MLGQDYHGAQLEVTGSSKLDPRSVESLECHLLGASESGTGNYRDTSQGKVHDSDVATRRTYGYKVYSPVLLL